MTNTSGLSPPEHHVELDASGVTIALHETMAYVNLNILFCNMLKSLRASSPRQLEPLQDTASWQSGGLLKLYSYHELHRKMGTNPQTNIAYLLNTCCCTDWYFVYIARLK